MKKLVQKLVDEFDKEFSLRDGWKDAWKITNVNYSPQTEPIIGRRFRAMGFALFSLFDEITFVPESGTGNGFLDFQVIHNNCRIAIEFKLLKNNSPKGTPPLPAYLQGVVRQLPQYVELIEAKHAFYVTGQHYNGTIDVKKNHSTRVQEVMDERSKSEQNLKTKHSYFESLTYVNINMSQRPSASKA